MVRESARFFNICTFYMNSQQNHTEHQIFCMGIRLVILFLLLSQSFHQLFSNRTYFCIHPMINHEMLRAGFKSDFYSLKYYKSN